ncbi:MAG TPA: TonB-dependent receptor [Thermoanaerobaculia bacterium]
MSGRTARSWGWTLFFALMITSGAFAQNTVGEISGYVRDTTGSALPGVDVRVNFADIGVERSTQTNGEGFYVLPGLPNGRADITAELQGFQRFVRRAVDVELNARMRLNITMALGSFSETVEVKGEEPALASTPDVAHLISGEQTKELAIDGRTYMQLVTLVPGVSRNEGSYEAGTSFRADGQQINGLRKNLASLTLDGAENLDAGSNATQVNNVSIDAVEEFKIISNAYSAEFGKAGGAQINVVTKRGTKEFRGVLYGFLRDDRFDEVNFRTGEKDVLSFRNFGWNAGGPIALRMADTQSSKLFFFAGQEYKKLESQVGLTRVVAVPSLLERRGDFSQSPKQPIDPTTGKAFTGGIIPAERLSRNGVALIAGFPLPDAGERAIATISPTQDRDIREDILRFDVALPRSSTLSARYIRDTVDQVEPYGSFGGTSGFAQVPTSHARLSDSFVSNFNQVFGASVLHDMTLSAVKNDQILLQTGDFYRRTGLNIPELFPSNRLDRAPNIRSLTGYTLGTGLLGNDYPTRIIGNYYTLKNNVTWLRGNHNLKAGTYFGQFRKGEEIRTPDAGAFTFSDTRTGGSRVALADALLGLFDRYTEADASPYADLRYNEIEVYGQDQWQIRPNLSLSIGLRYQYMPGAFDRHDRIATFDPKRYNAADAPQIDSRGNLVPGTGRIVNGLPVTGIVTAGVDGAPRSLYETDWNNFGPRFGFNWDPFNTARTMVRGGFGIFYDRPVFNSSRDQAASPPFVRTVEITNGSVDNPGGGAASTAPPGGFDALATDFQMPTIYAYSLGVQRELPWNIVAEVDYVGNQARHLLRVRELNYVTPNPATGLAPTPLNANRPYRGYGRIFINETTARSDYDSMQISINRRAAANLSFGIAYTLSRSRGDADSEDSSSSGSLAQDPRDPGAEYGYQDFDRRHVLAVNYIYRLPLFRSQEGLAGKLFGGWQVSGVTRYSSGRRLNITAGTNTSIFGDQITLRANLVPGQDPNSAPAGGRTQDRWLNIDAFARPGPGQLGTLPRNSVIGPSYFNTDLSVFKDVRVANSSKVQLRLEVFNVFNKKNYRTIETSMTNSRFGAVTEFEAPRIMQLGLKFTM